VRIAAGDLGYLMVFVTNAFGFYPSANRLWFQRTDGFGRALSPPEVLANDTAGYAVEWTDDAFGVLRMSIGDGHRAALTYHRLAPVE